MQKGCMPFGNSGLGGGFGVDQVRDTTLQGVLTANWGNRQHFSAEDDVPFVGCLPISSRARIISTGRHHTHMRRLVSQTASGGA